MGRLALLVYVIVAPTLAGIFMVACLVAGISAKMMIIAILAGFVLAIPVAMMLGRKIA
jgi:hypothetical protein